MSCVQMFVNITYIGETLIMPLYKTMFTPHLECCIQQCRPYHTKYIDTLDREQCGATVQLVPELKQFCYEKRLLQCGLTLESRDYEIKSRTNRRF